MASNVYVVLQKDLGYKLTINDSSITCEDFKKTCDIIVNEYGKDIFIVHEKLIELYGFNKASIQCVYKIE
ncbi:MAG: hypothetical protein ACRCYC_05120 [Paraclostridium sp.]|uniref:hypothetical protein n=1 Tax=Paraclostridium sp. TaxID=2023273 RepID=UPI003F2C9C65